MNTLTKPEIFQEVTKLMGNRFEFSVVSEDPDHAKDCISLAIEEVRRIEYLFSTYKEDSETNLVNNSAGLSPVKVSKEFFDLVERCQRISSITQGAFDITYGSIDKKLWNFDQSMTSLPDEETRKKLVQLINFRNIILDRDALTVFLKEKGMRIGFGGIGKGYAADRAKEIMISKGVQNGIVNAAGDLTAWGLQPDGKKWTIGIADPEMKSKPFSFVEISGLSVATSGNYEKFVTINGKRYSHTIDPKTGLPVQGIKSVTVITPIAELSDALATPVSVMGIKAGLDMINQLKNVACIIIDDNNVVHTSKNITLK
jgi:thiamine biosynthesis lipoprotein